MSCWSINGEAFHLNLNLFFLFWLSCKFFINGSAGKNIDQMSTRVLILSDHIVQKYPGRSIAAYGGFLFLLAACISIFPCCKGKSDRQGGAKIITGKNIDIANETIPVSGGRVVVNAPGNPLNDLAIDIPANAYENKRKFHISFANVQSYDCRPDFHPLTPLITISNGGGYSQDPMVLTMPVHVLPGHFAMAFIYNDETGQLEGMPLLASDGIK